MSATQRINVTNESGIELLNRIENNSIDLILTDPPYIISKKSGMDTFFKQVKKGNTKTEKDWEKYSKKLKKPDEEIKAGKGLGWSKDNYLKYGHIQGKRYCTKTDFGEWDKNFTMEELEETVKLYYKKLRRGGTVIIWFDLWKISQLKEVMEKCRFKQIRLIEWLKTNPMPINSKTNYLTNAREIALLGVKHGKPVFNSSYDNGVYRFPIASGKYKFHPTQKNLKLFIELIKKHSNEGDVVLDSFLGGGTTAIASKVTGRNFIGCDINTEYVTKTIQILKNF